MSRSLHRVGHAPRAARQLHAARRVLAQRAHELLADRERLREQHARLRAAVRAAASAASTFSSAFVPKPFTSLSCPPPPPAQVVDRAHAELVVEQLRALGAEAGDARDLHEPDGMRLELVGRRDRAGLEQRVDLLGDRLADAGELDRAALRAQLGHRHAGLADRLRGVAVGHHAVHDRAVELVEARPAPRRPRRSRRCRIHG